MRPIGTKPIKTQRLYLRSPRTEDAAALVQIRSLPMAMDEANKAVAGMIAECQKPFCFHWVITLEGAVIGRIKAWDVDPYNGYLQLGYDMGAEYRCHGYMTEAVKAMCGWALRQEGVLHITAETEPSSTGYFSTQ